MEWRDMKDAPRDGTWVMLSIKGNECPSFGRFKVGKNYQFSEWEIDCQQTAGHDSEPYADDREVEAWAEMPNPKWKIDQQDEADGVPYGINEDAVYSFAGKTVLVSKGSSVIRDGDGVVYGIIGLWTEIDQEGGE